MTDREAVADPKKRRNLIIGLVAVVVVLVVVIGVAVPLIATSTPRFFGRYHLLERRFVNLEGSAHEGISCRTCHETQPVQNGMALIADYYTGLFRKDPKPRYFTFAPPKREACLQCHEDDWSSDSTRTAMIPHPAHQRVADEKRDCVQCHKWTAHFETYMEKHKKMPFSGVCVAYGCHVGTKKTRDCFECHHILHENGEQWRTEHPEIVKQTGENACLEQCHKVEQCQECHTTGKRPDIPGQRIEVSMKSIEELHVKPDWTSRYHGAEALKGKDRCMLCHQSSGECDECHLQRPAFHGSTATWIGRHSKQAKAVDDPRCVACHKVEFCEDCHEQFKEME